MKQVTIDLVVENSSKQLTTKYHSHYSLTDEP